MFVFQIETASAASDDEAVDEEDGEDTDDEEEDDSDNEADEEVNERGHNLYEGIEEELVPVNLNMQLELEDVGEEGEPYEDEDDGDGACDADDVECDVETSGMCDAGHVLNDDEVVIGARVAVPFTFRHHAVHFEGVVVGVSDDSASVSFPDERGHGKSSAIGRLRY